MAPQRSPLRRLLLLIAALATGAAALAGIPAQAAETGLKDVSPSRLAVGGAVSGYSPDWERNGVGNLVDTEFSAMTAMNYMGWNTWVDPDEPIQLDGLERVADWSAERGKKLHGHVLVYPLSNEALPWFQSTDIDHEAVLEEYVKTVAGSTRGRMWVWDVVNEVMADVGDSRADEFGLRTQYVEYNQIGPDYVDKAFRWAREADPEALLILNDYGAEAVNEKSDRLLRYVIELRDRGVPIDGVGFQMHIDGSQNEPDYDSIRRNLQRFADAGFKLFITEMDVSAYESPTEFPRPSDEQLERQQRIYREIARIAVENTAVESLLLWDFVDGRSWLNPTDRPLGDTPIGSWTYPTPFYGGSDTEEISKKPAYQGLFDGLSASDDSVTPTTTTTTPTTTTPTTTTPTVDPTTTPPSTQDVDSSPSEEQPLADGLYRLTSDWDSDTSYLNRAYVQDSDGTWEGTNRLTLDPLNPDWWSTQWHFESVGDNVYRIRAASEAHLRSYLTRRGDLQDDGSYRPTDQLLLQSLNTDWPSQLWTLEEVRDGAYRLRSGWSGDDGYLTRLGTEVDGGFEPADSVHLHARDTDWSSQVWTVSPVS